MQSTILESPQATVLELEPKVAQLPAVAQPNLPAAAITPADLLRIAMERDDKDIDRLERLMAMDERYRESQERERRRDSELAFRRDSACFRGENIIVPKSKRVDRGRGGSFNQSEFDVTCRLLSPALSKWGFNFRHDMRFGTKLFPTADNPENQVGWVFVTCYLEHREGFVEKLELDGPPDDQSVNSPVQNMQSTASFLKRQSLLAITGTATGGEDDESRMRGQAKAEEKRGEFDELLDAGRAAAIDGTQALTAWWGTLGNKQRSLMNREFGQLRKDAAVNDKPVDHTKEARRG